MHKLGQLDFSFPFYPFLVEFGFDPVAVNMPGLVATGLKEGVQSLPDDEKADINIAFFDELMKKLKLDRNDS